MTGNTESLLARFRRVRATTLELVRPLSAEDMQVQSMEDVSPTKWHLGHTTWFFETFVLETRPGFRPFDEAFRVLFNSYYEQIGNRHPRPQRGLLTRPHLEQVLDFRRSVDERVEELLGAEGEALAAILELGIQHEQQHQELLLMDIQHVLSCNPLHPAYRPEAAPTRTPVPEQNWHHIGGGLVEIGHPGGGFAFDNEGPAHRAQVEDFALAHRPLTNADVLAFVEGDGYDTEALWLSDAWTHLQRVDRWTCPMYWKREEGHWAQFTLHGLEPLRLEDPATHLSYYEADAIARFHGGRLPTEFEWEHAARDVAIEGNFLEDHCWYPRAQSEPSASTPAQLFGDVWEWTQSAYSAYPGYRPAEGAVGEYNGKFMVNQYVLRGGCWATARGHVRHSYRNFFHPWARWQHGGLRLAKDL